LPAPRHGAGQPLCRRGSRPPPRASSPQLRPRRGARRSSGGGRATVTATPSGAPFAESVRPSRDLRRPVRSPRRRPQNPSPTAAATDDGRRGCRRGGGRATAAASRTGQVPQTVAGKHANAAIPPPPHRERVAVASPRRRPAGVAHRPRQRRADHRHVGREGGAEGARSRQRRGGPRRRVTGWGGRGTSPPHPPGGDGEAPPARDRHRHRRGRRRPLGWRRSGWWGTRRRRGRAPPEHARPAGPKTRKQRRVSPLQYKTAPCWRPSPRERFSDT